MDLPAKKRPRKAPDLPPPGAVVHGSESAGKVLCRAWATHDTWVTNEPELVTCRKCLAILSPAVRTA